MASALTEDPSLSEAELMREVAAATTALLPDVTDIELLSAVKSDCRGNGTELDRGERDCARSTLRCSPRFSRYSDTDRIAALKRTARWLRRGLARPRADDRRGLLRTAECSAGRGYSLTSDWSFVALHACSLSASARQASAIVRQSERVRSSGAFCASRRQAAAHSRCSFDVVTTTPNNTQPAETLSSSPGSGIHGRSRKRG